MNSHPPCLAIIAAILISASASVDQQATSAEPRQEKVYATGSRIPVRDRGDTSSDVRSVDNRGASEILQKRDSTNIPTPMKGGTN